MALPSPSPASTALVTGASSGIGAELARALARKGHGLTLVARRLERLESLAGELSASYDVPVHPLRCDVADPVDRDALVGRVAELGLRVDVLVNSAGFGIYVPFHESERERELEQLRTNVEAVVDFTARWLPGMLERGRGAVINLSSTAALQPLPGNSTYAASKAYVLLFSEALHAEAAPHGVTVTAVLPGPVRTEFQDVAETSFADRLPGFVWRSAAEVAEQALTAAERGKRTLIPGTPVTRALFAPNRIAPRRLVLAVGKRLMESGRRTRA